MVAGLLGFALGALTLRLRGIFFSIATVAVAVMIETVVMNWGFVGGARGTTVLQPAAPALFGTYTRFLFFVMSCWPCWRWRWRVLSKLRGSGAVCAPSATMKKQPNPPACRRLN